MKSTVNEPDVERQEGHNIWRHNVPTAKLEQAEVILKSGIRKPTCNFYLLVITMFALSVKKTVCEVLTVEMCVTLTPTVRMGKGQM